MLHQRRTRPQPRALRLEAHMPARAPMGRPAMGHPAMGRPAMGRPAMGRQPLTHLGRLPTSHPPRTVVLAPSSRRMVVAATNHTQSSSNAFTCSFMPFCRVSSL